MSSHTSIGLIKVCRQQNLATAGATAAVINGTFGERAVAVKIITETQLRNRGLVESEILQRLDNHKGIVRLFQRMFRGTWR